MSRHFCHQVWSRPPPVPSCNPTVLATWPSGRVASQLCSESRCVYKAHLSPHQLIVVVVGVCAAGVLARRCDGTAESVAASLL